MSSRITMPPGAPSHAAGESPWRSLRPGEVAAFVSLEAVAEEVHLWALPLAESDDEGAAETLLSADERDRAARFRFARDRRRFSLGRAGLRRLLGIYLDRDPAALDFAYGPAGKPELAGSAEASGLRFNLSNSADWALLAVARGRQLGVDLEGIPEGRDLMAIARRFFAAEEVTAFEGFAADQRAEAFCAIWTRKEALLKAFGAGLSLPLDGFCVSADPAAPARLLSTAFRPAEAARWSLADIALAPPLAGAFRAALAIEGPPPHYRCFRLAP